ncbi:DUF4129 domain-containing protein [Halococcus qingdaonensis]|uniref:DUF4129 domain-containing protein n=1 Tax=Halococcus qingdaonensis TaxID=224402 RepID=UPI0021165BA6|nr:DUF4129 domain-containing protein [Halococcus qingdaonensis]
MNRDALGVVVLAALAILAIAVGAAAIDAPTQTAGSATGSGGGSGGFFGEGQIFDLGQQAQIDSSGGSGVIEALLQLLVIVLVGGFLLGLYVLRDELGLRDLGVVALGSVVLAGLLFGLYRLLGLLGNNDAANGSGVASRRTPVFPGGGSDGAADSVAQTVSTDPLLVLAVATVFLVGIGLLVRSGWTTDEDKNNGEPTPAASNSSSPSVAELGRAAGNAADRIADDTSTDNEIYRAWREMIEQLNMGNPRSRTPEEFARAATDAGMARENVTELTDVFRAVRYGGTDATDEREARAVAALRRIEDDAEER